MRLALALLLSLFAVSARASETPAEAATRAAGEGRYEDAVASFEEAVRLEPKNASLHLGLGLAYQSVKRYRDATLTLEKAAALAPESADARYSLGLLYEAAAADPAITGEPKTPASAAKLRRKAVSAWEAVLKLAKDEKRLAAAKSHLAKLKEPAP